MQSLLSMKIAIQGETGAFSHEAALRMVPHCKVVPCALSAEVFDRVERGSVDGAVIPIENTLAGSVAEHFDLLLSREVFIQSEFPLRIVHNLIAAPGVKLRDVRQVFSHPVALDQCRDFFRKHRNIEPVAFYDTAGSVKHVIEKKMKNAAGIAAEEAARVYGGAILKAGIEDNKQNFTRFFHILKKKRVRPGANKTSLAFSVKNIPGRVVQGAERVRFARYQPEQDRVAPGEGPSVGVRFLRRYPARRRRAGAQCAAPSGRSRGPG